MRRTEIEFKRGSDCWYSCAIQREVVACFSSFSFGLLLQKGEALQQVFLRFCIAQERCTQIVTDEMSSNSNLTFRMGSFTPFSLPAIDKFVSVLGLVCAAVCLAATFGLIVLGIFWKQLVSAWIWPSILFCLVVNSSYRVYTWTNSMGVLEWNNGAGSDVLLPSIFLDLVFASLILSFLYLLVLMILLVRWIDLVHLELFEGKHSVLKGVKVVISVLACFLAMGLLIVMVLMRTIYLDQLLVLQSNVFDAPIVLVPSFLLTIFGAGGASLLSVYVLVGRRKLLASGLAKGVQLVLINFLLGLSVLVLSMFIQQLIVRILRVPALGYHFPSVFLVLSMIVPETLLSFGFLAFVVLTWLAGKLASWKHDKEPLLLRDSGAVSAVVPLAYENY